MRYLYVLCRHGKPLAVYNSYEHAEYNKMVKQHIYGDDDIAYRIYDIPYSYYRDHTEAIEDHYHGYRSVIYKYYLNLVNKLGVYKGCKRLLGVLQEYETRRNILSSAYGRLSKRVVALENDVSALESFNKTLIKTLRENNIYVDL